jgi:hypothetical protein
MAREWRVGFVVLAERFDFRKEGGERAGAIFGKLAADEVKRLNSISPFMDHGLSCVKVPNPARLSVPPPPSRCRLRPVPRRI